MRTVIQFVEYSNPGRTMRATHLATWTILLTMAVVVRAAVGEVDVSDWPRATGEERKIIQAIEAGDLAKVQSLWHAGIDVNRRFPWSPYSYLHKAAGGSNAQVVAWLLERGADIDYCQDPDADWPYTPIRAALAAGKADNARLLAKHGADLDVVGAAAVGDVQRLRRFIEADRSLLKKKWNFSRISEECYLLQWAACFGATESIEALVELGADPLAANAAGFTALYLAAAWERTDAVEVMLKHDRRIDRANEYGWSPLRIAAHNGDTKTAKLLIRAGAKLDIFSAIGLKRIDDVKRIIDADAGVLQQEAGTDSVVQWAVQADAPDILKLLIKRGANVNHKHPHFANHALQKAAWLDRGVCAKILTDAGADLNAGQGKDAYGPPLQHAAWRGHTEFMAMLLDAGANIEAVNNTNETALCCAVGREHIDAVKLLLARGAKPDGQPGQPPLTGCHDHENTTIARLLIAAGANVSAPDKHVGSPLHYAIDKGSTELVELMLAQPIDPGVRGENHTTLLHRAPLAKDKPLAWRKRLVDRLLKLGLDLEEGSYGGYTVLARAVYKQVEPEMIQHLIKRGAKVNALTSDGYSVLTVACFAHRLQADVVKLLLEAGADANLADKTGKTPLHRVLTSKEADAVAIRELLMAHGGRLDALAMAKLGKTAALKAMIGQDPGLVKREENQLLLHTAAGRGDLEMVKLLLDAGAEVDPKDDNRMTAMHTAVLSGKTEVVRHLLSVGADANQRSRFQHPLYSAAFGNRLEIAKMLLDAGAQVDQKTLYQYTALSTAGQHNHVELMELLLDAGAEVDLITKNNHTALTLAIEAGALDAAKLLHARGAELVGFGDDYSPPLHDAATRETTDLLKWLLSLDELWVNRPNERGDTALDWAVTNNKDEHAAILRAAGALRGQELFKAPRIAKWLEQLDSEVFAEREEADRTLRAFGHRILPAARQYLEATESAEVRLRLEQMIKDLEVKDR